ncbi:MAG: hypothetical protein SFU25_04900 [Candidatus Caenarcaniphilales bacterium]|nr:hypothetical protein [Candidatus Caenarcaniphilales bacterium]
MNLKKLLTLLSILILCLPSPTKAWQKEKRISKLENKAYNKNYTYQNKIQNEAEENKDDSLLKYISSHKLIHTTQEVDIYQSEASVQESLLEDYFRVYRLEFLNKSAYPINFEGQVFNRISAEEAHARLAQHQNLLKRKKRKIKIIGYAWLITTSIVGGFYAPSLVLYRFLQKTIASSIVSTKQNLKNRKEQMNSLKVINEFIDEDRQIQRFTVDSKKTYELWYVLPIHPETDPIILFKSSSAENPKANLFFYSKDIDTGDIKQLSQKSHKELISTAFVDGELLEGFRAGFYLNQNKKFTLLKYSKNGYHDFERNQNSYVKINDPEPNNIFQSSKLKLVVQQNIFKRPSRYQISLLKLRVNPNDLSRESNGEFVQFALEEVKPGLLEFRSPKRSRLNLDAGNYALLVKNGSKEPKVYDFQII